MTLHGSAVRLTIFITESGQWHHRPAYTEIVHRAHAAGLAGASVFRGVEGYGRSSHIHTNRILSLSEDLPVVDRHRRRGAARSGTSCRSSTRSSAEGLVMIEPVEVVRYVGPEGAS